jgi:Helix-turn-helix of DDE superfamily endonuclease
MTYEQVKDLPPAEFKRYRGVQPETFRRMVEVVSGRLNRQRRISGRPTKLPVEDQVLMTLEYRREYRTFFHIAKSWASTSRASGARFAGWRIY